MRRAGDGCIWAATPYLEFGTKRWCHVHLSHSELNRGADEVLFNMQDDVRLRVVGDGVLV